MPHEPSSSLGDEIRTSSSSSSNLYNPVELELEHYQARARLGSFTPLGLCKMAQKLVNILKQMDPRGLYQIEMNDALLEKLRVSLFSSEF